MGQAILPSSDFGKIVLGQRALGQLTPPMAPKPGNPPGQTNQDDETKSETLTTERLMVADINPEFVQRFKEGIENFSDPVIREAKVVRVKRERAVILAGMLFFLSTVVRDAWSGIRRRARRKKLPDSYLVCYKMPLEADRKVTGSKRGWILMSEELERGDVEAVKAGFPAMTNPDRTEVIDARMETQAVANEADNSKVAHKGVQEQLMEQRTVVHALIRELGAILRLSLREKPASVQREIMRTYGFLFNDDPAPRPEVTEDAGSSIENLPIIPEPA